MPLDFEYTPFLWLLAATSFGGLGLVLVFGYVRGFNADIIVTGFLALGLKAIGSFLILASMPIAGGPVPVETSVLLLLPVFLLAVFFEFMAIIKTTKQEWPFKTAMLLLVLGLGCLVASAALLSGPVWSQALFIIPATLILFYSGIAAFSALGSGCEPHTTRRVLGLSLAGIALISAAALSVELLSDTLPEPLAQITPEDLFPGFILLAILQSLALVLIIQAQAHAERTNRRLLDPQTGVLNLDGFEKGSRNIRHMCGRLDQAVSMVMMQLSDHDTLRSKLSKKQSAKLLKDLVAITSFCLRKYDQIARLDNNCFVMLLPFTDIARAQQACERLQKQLAVELFIEEGDTRFPVAVSMGVTDVPRAEKGVEAAIKRADKALQHAGRNEIRLHPARRPEAKAAS